MKDPVQGTAQIVSCSPVPYDVRGWSNCKMHVVLQAEGMQPFATEHTDWLTPTSKWPSPGETVPVTVDRANPKKFKIEWDDVQTGSDAGQEQAERIAAALRAGGASAPALGQLSAGAAGIVSQLQQLFPGAQVNAGKPEAESEERLADLERLAKLKESGALTDAEFAAEKARILGES